MVNKKSNKKNGKITIDKLGIMIANGFEGVYERFEKIEENMATKDDIKGLKKQIEGADKRIDDLAVNRVKYEEFDSLKKRVNILEKV